MPDTKLIILNGASSAGKSVLCKKLQEVLDEPYIHLQEDCFVYDTYHDRFLDSPLAPQIFRMTMLGYYRSLRAFLLSGHNVLADTGFYTPELLQTLVRELAAEQERVWLVGVRCSLEELERREQARTNRQSGLAREQFESIHAGALYDIEVDTTAASPEDCARAIKARLAGGTPGALGRLGLFFGR
jgi:chloramphenicol 3-O phosphotransferase